MTTTIAAVAPSQVSQLQQAGESATLIDVRTPAEFREIHAVGARNVPLDQLDDQSVRQIAEEAAGKTVYAICRSGARAGKACEKLAAAGMLNVVNVEGGTQAWEAAGLPVVRGQKTISLERQVRIAAGSLVLIGSLLTWLVHPGFLALPAFIGAGLVFAGVTDTCGMGMMLARMPWNQAGKCDAK